MSQEKKLQANIWKMYIFYALIGFHFFSAVLIPFFTDWGHINFTQIMILQSAFMIFSFLLEVPTGAVADYFGRKTSVVLSCASIMIASLVYVSAPNFYVFLLGEFIFALGFALASGADEALVYDSLKMLNRENESKKVFARMDSIHMFGIMFAAPIGGLIAKKFGLQYPMLFSLIPMFFAFLMTLTLKEPELKKEKETKRYIHIIKESFISLKNNKNLRILALDSIAIGSLAYFIIWLYQVILKNFNVDIQYFGFVHAMLCLAQILIMTNYEKLEKLFGSKKRVLFFSSFITGIAMIVCAISGSLILTLVAFAIGVGFGYGRFPIISSYMNKYIESYNRATVISGVSMFRRLFQAVFNPLIGLLIAWSMNYTLIMLGISALVFSFISRVEEKHLID